MAAVVISAVCCVLAVAWSGSSIARGPKLPARVTEPTYVPSTRFLELVSLGHRNVAADLLWFQATNYFGKRLRTTRRYEWLARMCDTVTDLDPKAEHVYRFAGAILPWEARQPEAGARLLAKGADALPDDWRLQYLAGFTYYFFLDDFPAALKYMKRAAGHPNAHPLARRIFTRLARGQAATDSAVEFLENMVGSAQNAGVRVTLQQQLDEARFAASMEVVEKAVDAFESRHGRPPLIIEELVLSGELPSLPRDSFGGWIFWDPAQGDIASTSGHERIRLFESKKRQLVRMQRRS